MIWNTRWMHQWDEHDDIFYGFDANNGLMPSTMCLYLWGRFMRKDILMVENTPDGVVGYASKDETGLTVFLINKRVKEVTVSLENLQGIQADAEINTYVYIGMNPNDKYPEFRKKDACKPGEPITLLPYSLTILDTGNK
jgi:hypothetical protein